MTRGPRKILVISTVPTHPQNAGNRARIHAMLALLKELGHEVHLVYENREFAALHVDAGPDLAAMSAAWDAFFCAPLNLGLCAPVGLALDRWRHAKPPPGGDSLRARTRLLHGVLRFWGRLAKRLVPGFYDWLRDEPFGVGCPEALDARYNPRLGAYVERVHRTHGYDVVLVEYVFNSKLLEGFGPDVLKIVDSHDRFANRGDEFERAGLRETFFTTSESEEARGLSRADRIIAIQDREKAMFDQVLDRRVITVGHLVRLEEPQTDRVLRGRLFYIGSGIPANVHGVTRFIRSILPEIRRRVPGVTLTLAGKICDRIEDFEGGVRLGEIPDLAVGYRDADIVVNPAFVGTGLKIKSVEALGFGKPLVSSPLGVEGLEAESGRDLAVARCDEEFVGWIVRLLEDRALYDRISLGAHAFAREYNRRSTASLADVLR